MAIPDVACYDLSDMDSGPNNFCHEAVELRGVARYAVHLRRGDHLLR